MTKTKAPQDPAEALREATREAREALKDLTAMVREARTLVRDELAGAEARAVKKFEVFAAGQITECGDHVIKEFGKTANAARAALETVFTRFQDEMIQDLNQAAASLPILGADPSIEGTIGRVSAALTKANKGVKMQDFT